ncbi:MAG: hypothetical protein Nk1A_6770 [Endomicrobiia bacterium]|nr:MAG: hypothetical protein Nk1A_6770 [Endomicrobiia bacterium]
MINETLQNKYRKNDIIREPMLRKTKKTGKDVCNFRVAIQGTRKDSESRIWQYYSTDFLITSWDKLARKCQQKLKLWSTVFVKGKLQTSM